MSAVIPFSFEGARVRVLTRDEAPWFVLADVCRVLEIGNPSDAARRLDDDERMTLDNIEGHSGHRGGAQSFTIISESGLYALILTSRKPAAKRFRKWVTAEVLPAIRRTGGYALDGAETARPVEADPDLERLWLNKVNLALRVYGRQAAREIWELSPLPKPSEGVRHAEAVLEARACLRRLLARRLDDGAAVGDLVGAAAGPAGDTAHAANQDLKRLGLEVRPAPTDRATGRPKWPGLFLWVATHLPGARRLTWLPGARANVPFWAGGQVKAVLVPAQACLEEWPGPAEGGDGEMATGRS